MKTVMRRLMLAFLVLATGLAGCRKPRPARPGTVSTAGKYACGRQPTIDLGGRVMRLARDSHACALLSDGTVRCWGPNRHGELGNGTRSTIGDDELPRAAASVELGGRAVDVAVGHGWSCAVLDSGVVKCWGRLLVDPDSRGSPEIREVDVGGPVVSLSGASQHACALLTEGRVRCWGANYDGELGYGTNDPIKSPAARGDVDVGGRVVQLALGEYHTCALLDRGSVRCWGDSSEGQLGYGSTTNIGDDEAPAVAGDVPVGGRVTQIAAGDSHTCALLASGSVRCWGYGLFGALGYGSTETIGDDEPAGAAGDVPLDGRATRIAAGSLRTCAVLEDGSVRCWGLNDGGGLGNQYRRNIGDDEPASASKAISLEGRVVDLSLALSSTCVVLDSGIITCWGWPSCGVNFLPHSPDLPIFDAKGKAVYSPE